MEQEDDAPGKDDEEAVDDYNSNVDYAQERVAALKDRIEELRKEASGQTAERLDELLEIAEDLDDRADCLYL